MRFALCLVLLVACKGEKQLTTKELVEKYKAQIEPRLAAIEKIRNAPLPAPTGTIALDGGPQPNFSNYAPYGNLIYAYWADLEDMKKYEPNQLRYNFMAEIVNDCYLTVREGNQAIKPNGVQGNFPTEAYLAKDLLPMCGAARYLIVIDLKAFKDTEYIDKEHFGMGAAAADAHLFDLETGKYLGGVSFETTSSKYTSDPDSDLRDRFHKAMEAALRKFLPDSKLS